MVLILAIASKSVCINKITFLYDVPYIMANRFFAITKLVVLWTLVKIILKVANLCIATANQLQCHNNVELYISEFIQLSLN